MSLTITGPSTSRHPWLEVFSVDPVRGFGDLLAGYAPTFPFSRADAPDAARMLFGPLPSDDFARLALSSGVLGWLETARRTPLSADMAARQNTIREVCEALEIIALLRVTDAAVVMRQEYLRWATWTQQLVMVTARDAQLAYFRMLAQTQGAVADLVANPDALAPLWMRLCREAGGNLPEHYLQIGLLGLRQLPGSIQRGDTPWIAGLAAWALKHDPSDHQFMRYWRPLKRLYPTSPGVLRKQIFNVLEQRPYKDAEIEPPAWWSADPDVRIDPRKATKVSFEPPSLDVLQETLVGIRNGVAFSKLRPKLDVLTERYRIYTERSGDDHNLNLSFNNIGMTLIRDAHEAHVERARYAQSLARESLSYRPNDLYAWSLWRDALAAEGALNAARELGWEKVRRFPEDPKSRTELVNILAQHMGALEEAIAIGHETIELFPENAYARTQLAEVLIANGQEMKALNVILAAITSGAANAVAYAVLARLRAHQGDIEGARRAIVQGLRVDPYDQILLAQMTSLERGVLPQLVSTGYRTHTAHENVDTTDPTLAEVLRDGRLRALRNRLDDDQSARADLKVFLAEDPAFAYAQLLAARHGLWNATSDVLPPVAAAFEAALADEDRAQLVALAKRAPKLEALILLARALLGDPDAARSIADRLIGADDLSQGRSLHILRSRLGPVLAFVRGGGAPLVGIQGNAGQVRQALYDLNEALSAPELIAA